MTARVPRDGRRYATLFREGSRCTSFLLVLRGQVQSRSYAKGNRTRVAVHGVGSFFGVESLAFGECHRDAALEATEDTLVLMLCQEDLLALGVRLAECRVHVVSQIMDDIPWFKDLSKQQHAALSRIVNIVYAEHESTLFLQGDVGDVFFILIEGRVGMYRKQLLSRWRMSEEELIFSVSTEQEAPWFGEVALARVVPRAATARCLEACKFFVVPKAAGKKFLQICPDFAPIIDQAVTSFSKINALAKENARERDAARQKARERRGTMGPWGADRRTSMLTDRRSSLQRLSRSQSIVPTADDRKTSSAALPAAPLR